MVGRPGPIDYQIRLNSKIQKTSNLEYYGELSLDKVNYLLSKSKLLVNTSMPREGFPNIFIQSWLSRTPVATLNVDPDNINVNERIGFHSKTFDNLIINVRDILSSELKLNQMGERAQRYATKNHNLKNMIDLYDKEFSQLFRSR